MRDTLTEAEAKGKWCPLVRQLGTLRQPAVPGGVDYVVASGSQNRGYQMGGALDNCRCIASECMAWRFDEAEFDHGECLPLGTVPADPGWEQDGETWYCGPGVTGEKRTRWKRAKPRTGYCNAFERVRSW